MRVTTARGRRGYTLVEILVVLGILVLLIALLSAGVMSFMDTGPQTVTATNLASIRKKVDVQWKAVQDAARQEPIPAAMLADVQKLAGNKTAPGPVRDAYVKYKLRQAFPTSFKEAFYPGDGTATGYPSLKPWEAYVKFLGDLGITAANVDANTTPAPSQQAVLLLVTLERGPRTTGVTADSWGSSAVGKVTVKTPGGDRQVDGFVDGWQEPVSFNRETGNNYNLFLLSGGRDKVFGNSDDLVDTPKGP